MSVPFGLRQSLIDSRSESKGCNCGTIGVVAPASNKMRETITNICARIMVLFRNLIIIGIIVAKTMLFVYQCFVLANNINDPGCGRLYGTLLATVIIQAIALRPICRTSYTIAQNYYTDRNEIKAIDALPILMFILFVPFVMSCILISTYNKLENDATCHDYWFDNHRMFYDIYYLTYIDAVIGIVLFSIICFIVLMPLMCVCCICCYDICCHDTCCDICSRLTRHALTQNDVRRHDTIRQQPGANPYSNSVSHA